MQLIKYEDYQTVFVIEGFDPANELVWVKYDKSTYSYMISKLKKVE